MLSFATICRHMNALSNAATAVQSGVAYLTAHHDMTRMSVLPGHVSGLRDAVLHVNSCIGAVVCEGQGPHP